MKAARSGILCVLGCIYLSFLFCDIFVPSFFAVSSLLKYAGMLLCFSLAALSYWHTDDKRDALLLIVALCFTLAADFFLLFTSRLLVGVVVFCGAHLTYLLRYCKSAFFPAFTITVLLFLFIAVCALIGFSLPYLYIVCTWYTVLIVGATLAAFFTRYLQPNYTFVRLGMVLFLLCDVNVALFNTLYTGSVWYKISAVSMWLFYLPAQALLSLSAFHTKKSNL